MEEGKNRNKERKIGRTEKRCKERMEEKEGQRMEISKEKRKKGRRKEEKNRERRKGGRKERGK